MSEHHDTHVAAIYFPSWHDDPRRAEQFGPGWSEWELIKVGRPRFEGHYQPIVPAWGYTDETDPDVMRRSCREAARAGIDAFLWDWYWYDERDFLNRPLDETYLALDQPETKFALMWANHDWYDVFPARIGRASAMMAPGATDARQFREMTDVIIERYLTNPNYWRVDGKAWFTIFELHTLKRGLGGDRATAEALTDFRKRARAAGAGELHINVMRGWDSAHPGRLADLGINSWGHYNWLGLMPTDQGLDVPYRSWREAAARQWRTEQAKATPEVAFIPNLTMGWDSTTRVHQDDELVIQGWPALPVITGNTPAEFEAAAEEAMRFLDERDGPRILTINAWNEWTEGSYLEPDDRYGTAYLDALARVFRDET
jgi:hypothetical protein